MPDGAQPVLDVRDLKTVFRTRTGEVHAVNSVSFHLRPGELLGVVGESGSGKSVTMMSLIGLLPSPPAEIRGGSVMFEGRNLLTESESALRKIRGRRIGFVFQDPMTSLNPVFTVGDQLTEPLKKHMNMSRRAARARAVDLLELVGIPDADRRLSDYPHQFSGGMRQRVMIAIALACDPDILIADEPTTALDVTIQAQILELVKNLREKLGMAIVWITHDLGVIAGIADRVMVMYGGQVVEQAPVAELFARPRHPYTRALLKTIPSVRGPRAPKLTVIEGQPPILGAAPTACPFRDRCPYRFETCDARNPPRFDVGHSHDAACFWDFDRDAPRDAAASIRGPVHACRRAPEPGRGPRPQDALPDPFGPVPPPHRRGEGGGRRQLRHPRGRDARPRRRIGVWQVHHGRDPAGLA